MEDRALQSIGKTQTGVQTDYRSQTKSTETFIKIGDVTAALGTHEGFVDYVQYYSLDFTMNKSMNPDAHNKLYSSGTVTMSNVRVVTTNHQQVPILYQKLITGDKVDKIETARTENTEGGTLRPIEKMTFTDCYITGLDYEGDKVVMYFRALKFQMDKMPTKQTGEQEGVITAGYDATTNKLLGA